MQPKLPWNDTQHIGEDSVCKNLKERLDAFLPQIQSANAELLERGFRMDEEMEEIGVDSSHSSDDDDGLSGAEDEKGGKEYIEMLRRENLGLGVLEEKREGAGLVNETAQEDDQEEQHIMETLKGKRKRQKPDIQELSSSSQTKVQRRDAAHDKPKDRQVLKL